MAEAREPSHPYAPLPRYGLDTPVLARLVRGDDLAQTQAALREIEQAAERSSPPRVGPTVGLRFFLTTPGAGTDRAPLTSPETAKRRPG